MYKLCFLHISVCEQIALNKDYYYYYYLGEIDQDHYRQNRPINKVLIYLHPSTEIHQIFAINRAHFFLCGICATYLGNLFRWH